MIGLPGDALVIKDGVLHVNDEPVQEPYADHALIDGYYSRTYAVPEGRVFLLGDNRATRWTQATTPGGGERPTLHGTDQDLTLDMSVPPAHQRTLDALTERAEELSA